MDIFSPLENLANLITYQVFSLSDKSFSGPALNFFIYDTLKISLMMLLISFIMVIFRYYLPLEKIKNILTSRKWYGLDYLLAAFFGVVTPFCSCSSIPLFIGFTLAGIPIGVTMTFLITSPLVNEASLAVLPAILGLKITIIYNLLGIIIGIIGGIILSKLHAEKYLNQDFLNLKINHKSKVITPKISFFDKLKLWFKESLNLSRTMLPYIILGVGLGSLIHGFVPQDFFQTYISGNKLLSVPLAALAGIPLYASSVSVIPLIQVAIEKGMPIGTSLAFMTSIVTLSLPQALILKKIMKPKLLLMFFAITTIGIIFIGYFFNFLT